MATTKITSPDLFDLGSLNTALKLPSGTTAERPTSPSTGEWRYNTTTNLVEFWDGGAWRDLQSEDIPPTPSEHFNVVLYDGTGSAQSITGVGFKPDLVWIKQRNGTAWHSWFDSTRGVGNRISSNSINAQNFDIQRLSSFDADGFSLGSDGDVNGSGKTFVAWCWKANGGTTSSNTEGTITSTVQANTKAAFSVVKFVGTGANATVGHGLGAATEIIIFKSSTAVSGWKMFTNQTSDPANQVMELNDPNGVAARTDAFNGTLPTSTLFSLGTYSDVNNNGNDMMAYCFASVAGYSSIGSYTGNGANKVVSTGLEPAWLMIKRTNGAGTWLIYDNKRNTSNPRNTALQANSDAADLTSSSLGVNFLTNGFEVIGNNGDFNGNGDAYIYIAFAADGSAAPALPDSFANKLYTGTGSTQSITGLGFSPSFAWIKGRTNTASHQLFDTLRGATYQISSDTTGAQTQNTQMLTSFDTDGFSLGNQSSVNGSGVNYVAWNWKANPVPTINTDGGIQSIVSANQASGFSIVKWDGTGSASTVGHGLSAAPEIILTKRLNGVGDWYSFSVFANGGTTPANYFLKLNSSDAETLNTGSPPSVFAGTVPTATVFSVGPTLSGSSSDNYIAYCFASISGFSKIGTYTGDGTTTKTITTGFQPNFVLIKVTDAADNWVILDSARGGSKNLKPNSSAAEATESGTNVEFTSTGFKLIGSGPGLGQVNGNGNDYLYMAFKENPTPMPLAGNMSFLVVAGGGGGGGNSNSGGGGAGGLRTSTRGGSGGGSSSENDIILAAGTYTITVGAGGTTGQVLGGSGVASSIAASGLTTISSVGGGGGAGQTGNIAGANGGSGGGGGYNNQAGGTGTVNQGFAGGTGSPSGDVPGGGGGGAAEAGNTDGTGHGGDGLSVEITGAAVFYAGGASGGVSGGGTQIPGSQGGGGAGAEGNNQAPVAGTTNLGSGGGGGAADTVGAAGGSGVVILRLATAEYSGTTTGSPTVTTDSTYTILTYTGSGTYVHS